MHILGVAVERLDRLQQLIPARSGTATRGVRRGRSTLHTVAAELLWTLERGLGESFTPEVRDAWFAAYEALSSMMKAGATLYEAAVAHA